MPFSPLKIENPSAILVLVPSLTQATNRINRYLISVLSQLGLGLGSNARRLLGLGKLASGSLLALVVCSTLNLSPLLKSVLSPLVMATLSHMESGL